MSAGLVACGGLVWIFYCYNHLKGLFWVLPACAPRILDSQLIPHPHLESQGVTRLGMYLHLLSHLANISGQGQHSP